MTEQYTREQKIKDVRKAIDSDCLNPLTALWATRCQLLLSEIDRLQQERDEWKAEAYKLAHVELERDKAIEGLKWYANTFTYVGLISDIDKDCGDKARSILSDLGVSL